MVPHILPAKLKSVYFGVGADPVRQTWLDQASQPNPACKTLNTGLRAARGIRMRYD